MIQMGGPFLNLKQGEGGPFQNLNQGEGWSGKFTLSDFPLDPDRLLGYNDQTVGFS